MRVILAFCGALLVCPALIAHPAAASDSCPPLTQITSVDTVSGPGGYMLVPVKFGDASRLMLFDTGGSLSSITPAAAKELNIPTFETGVKIADVAGKVSNRYARIPSLTIGRIEVKQVSYMVLPQDMAGDMQSAGVAGLLAPAPNIDLDLDFAAHKLAFFSTDHCEGKVVYWPADKIAIVPMRNPGAQRGPGFSTERITVPVQLDGKSLDALIDTGSTRSSLNLRITKDRLDVDLNSPDVKELGYLGTDKSAKTYLKRFATLSFEGVVVSNPVMELLPDKQSNAFGDQRRTGSLTRPSDTGLPDVIIGMDVLSKLHMYVAYKERKVYVTAAAAAGDIQTVSVSRPADPAVNIAGAWRVVSQAAAPVCEFMQNGGELTGTCTGPQATGELAGTVAGQAIRWQWKRIANASGAAGIVNFSGTMSHDNSITGFIEVNGRTAPFTATKQ